MICLLTKAPSVCLFVHRMVFWTVFGILFGTGFFYLLFADGEVQPWNDPKASQNRSIDDDDAEPSHEAKENFVKNF